jgi:2-dehydropantoate 2-reductase
LPEVAATLAPLIGRETVVVPLLNGMEAPEVLAAALGPDCVLGGLCGIVSFVVEPGHVRHAASEPFVMFGSLDGKPLSSRAERLREAFQQAGVKADIAPDILHAMWSKFLFITPMSAIGALTRLPIGSWRVQPEPRQVAVQMLREMISVAAHRGVSMGDEAVDRTLQRFDALAPESTSSLQRDVMNGLPSEHDAQLGAVVRMAHAAGVPVPVCETLNAILLPQERQARAKSPN